jgi:hypothetical protein
MITRVIGCSVNGVDQRASQAHECANVLDAAQVGPADHRARGAEEATAEPVVMIGVPQSENLYGPIVRKTPVAEGETRAKDRRV